MIIYITDINFNLISAQRKQVQQMIKALESQGIEYCVFSNEKITVSDKNITIHRKKHFNKLNLSLRALLHVRHHRSVYFYSRHLYFALIPLLFGYKSAYEIHDIPRKIRILWIQKFATNIFGLKIVSISENLSRILSGMDLIIAQTATDAVDLDLYDVRGNRPDIILDKIGNRPYLLHTGSLRKGSEIMYLINLAKNTDIDIVQIGCTEDEIVKYGVEYSSIPNLHFLPYIFDERVIANCQMNAKILLQLMCEDNLYFNVTSPLKVYEYLATGVPSIICRSGAMSDVIDNINIVRSYQADDMREFIREYQYTSENYESCLKIAQDYRASMSAYSWEIRVKNIVLGLGWNAG